MSSTIKECSIFSRVALETLGTSRFMRRVSEHNFAQDHWAHHYYTLTNINMHFFFHVTKQFSFLNILFFQEEFDQLCAYY